RESAEDAHWQLVDLPTKFPRHVVNQQTVDPALVLRHRSGIGQIGIAALEVNIERVAVASVVVKRWRELEIEGLWKIQPCANLPGQQKRIRIRRLLSNTIRS